MHQSPLFGVPVEQTGERAPVRSGFSKDIGSQHHRPREDRWTQLGSTQEQYNDESILDSKTRRSSNAYMGIVSNLSRGTDRNVLGAVAQDSTPARQPEWWTGIRKWLGLNIEPSFSSAESMRADVTDRKNQRASLGTEQDSVQGIPEVHFEGEENERQENRHDTAIHASRSAVTNERIQQGMHGEQTYQTRNPPGLRNHHHLKNDSASDEDIMRNMQQTDTLNSVWNEKPDMSDSEIGDTGDQLSTHESSLRDREEPSIPDIEEEEDLSDVETQQMVRTFLRLFRAIDRHIDNSLSAQKRTLHGQLKPRVKYHQITQSNELTNAEEHLGHITKHSMPSGNGDEDQYSHDVADVDREKDSRTTGNGHGRSVGSLVAGIMRRSSRNASPKKEDISALGADSLATRRRHVESEDEMEDNVIELSGIPRSAPSFTARKKLLHTKDPAAQGIWSHLFNRAVGFFENWPGQVLFEASSKSV
jgi:hypothetical protein